MSIIWDLSYQYQLNFPSLLTLNLTCKEDILGCVIQVALWAVLFSPHQIVLFTCFPCHPPLVETDGICSASVGAQPILCHHSWEWLCLNDVEFFTEIKLNDITCKEEWQCIYIFQKSKMHRNYESSSMSFEMYPLHWYNFIVICLRLVRHTSVLVPGVKNLTLGQILSMLTLSYIVQQQTSTSSSARSQSPYSLRGSRCGRLVFCSK